MLRIERFGSTWAGATVLPLHDAKYAMPADTSMRTQFRKSDGGIFTPEGYDTVRMAPPETFVYQGTIIKSTEVALEAEIQALSLLLGTRSYLWITDRAGTQHFKVCSLDSLRYNFATDIHYFTAAVTLQFSLEHEGWLLPVTTDDTMTVTGNPNVTNVVGNTITVMHDGNMDNYRTFNILIVPHGGTLTSTKITCYDYLTGAIKRTTLIYAGTFHDGDSAIFDYWACRLTDNAVVVRPVTRGTTAAENMLTEWGMMTKKTATAQGGARFNVICTGTATSYDLVVALWEMFAL